nr:Ig-like domain-containing protein [uncultured Amphritea sp.]
MTTTFQVIVQNSDGVLDSKVAGLNESLVYVNAQADTVIELRQLDFNVAPQQVLFKRNNADLEVRLSDTAADAAPDLVISNYYTLENPPALVGLAEDVSYYNFVPQTGLESDLLWELKEGEESYQSLGYDDVNFVFPWWPVVLGGLALGAVLADGSGGSDAAPVDNTGPNVTVDSILSKDNTPALTGTVDHSDAEITVIVDGIEYDAVNHGDGTWELADDELAELPEGETTVTVVATDPAGNQSQIDGVITIDTIPPAAPIIDPSNGDELTGTAEANSTVNIDIDGDGQTDLTTTADANGDWSVTPTTPIADGVEVSATATDEAGNTSGPGTTTIDASGPTNGDGLNSIAFDDALINAAEALSVTLSGQIESGGVLGSITLSDGTTTLTVDNADVSVDANGVLTISGQDISSLSDGEISVTMTVTDAVGNSGNLTNTSTLDATAPAAPIIDPSAGFELSGTAEANSTVNIDIDGDGQTDLTTTADANGDWSATPTTPIADGVEVSATATDEAGNTSGPGTTTIDATGPTNGDGLNSIAFDDALINATEALSVTLSGQIESGGVLGSITLSDGTTTLTVDNADVSVDANGILTISGQDITGLTDGKITVSMTISDSDGNTGNLTATSTLDATAPAAPIINPSAGFELSGTAEANSTVNIDIDGDGQTDLTTTADANGDWSATPTTPIADGVEVSATATDEAGNTSGPGTTTIDATGPSNGDGLNSIAFDDALINATEALSVTLSGQIESGGVLGTITLSDGTTTLTVDNADVSVDANGVLTISGQDISSLSDGEISVTMTVTDAVGNSGNLTNTSTLDATAPAAPVIDPSNGDELTGTAEASSTVNIDIDGDGQTDLTTTADANGDWSATPTTPIADGVEVSATATDEAGNTSGPGTTTIDATGPSNGDGLNSIAFDDALINATEALSVTLSGQIESGGVLGTITLSDGTTTLTVDNADVSVDANGVLTISGQDISSLSDGEISVTMTVTDAVGNSGNLTNTSTLDATAPAAPVIDSSNGDELTGTAEANSTVNIDIDGDGQTDLITTADANGDWSATPTTPIADGVEVSATATDEAGNTSDPGTTTIDATGPSNGDGLNSIAFDDALINATEALSVTLSGQIESGGELGTITLSDGTTTLTVDNADVSVDGSGVLTISGQDISSLSDGEISVTMTVTDAVGNSGNLTNTSTLDATAPAAPMINSSAGFELSGTAEANSTVNIDIDGDGQTDLTATADANGDWSATPTTPIADGVEVSATATDEAGNTSGPGTTTIDATGPTNGDGLNSIAFDDALINATEALSVTLSGQIESGGELGTITLSDGTTTLTVDNADVSVDGSGVLTISGQDISSLSDGEISVTMTVTDAVGNSGNLTNISTLDATAPAAPVIDPSNGDELTGTAEANSTVNIDIDGDGQTDLTTTADANGDWSATPATPIADGVEVSATATDEAGNTSGPGTTTIDATGPTNGDGLNSIAFDDALINATEALSVTLNGQIESGGVLGTITLSDGTTTLTVDNADVSVDANGVLTISGQDISSLSDGEISVTMTVTDAVGNSGNLTNTSTLDATAPAAPVIDSSNGDELTGTAEANSTVNIDIDGDGLTDLTANADANGDWSATPTTPIADGVEVSATATDEAGNTSGPGTTTIDATGPSNGDGLNSIAFDDALINATEALSVTLSGQIESGGVLGNITLSDGTTTLTVDNADVSVDANGVLTISGQDISSLSDGEISVTMTVTDAVGNSGNLTNTSTLDVTAPVIVDQIKLVDESALNSAVNGQLVINEPLDSVSVSLIGDAVTSGGDPVIWVLSVDQATGQNTYTGSTATGVVATLEVNPDGSYQFNLQQPLDHSQLGSDSTALEFAIQTVDQAGNSSSDGRIIIEVPDDVPVAKAYTQQTVTIVDTPVPGSFVQEASVDGTWVSSVTIDGYTFAYDAETNSVSTYGESDLVLNFSANDFDTATKTLVINTIKGESITVDLATGDYSYTTTGVAVVDPEVQEDPTASLGDTDSLLGLVGADALNLINLSDSQAFSVNDANNDITKVVIETSGITVALGSISFEYSQALAAEFGLSVTTEDINIFSLGAGASITIESLSGDPIDNEIINEFLGTVYLNNQTLLDLDALSSLSIEVTDSLNNTVTETSSDLLGLTALNVDAASSDLFEGDSTGNTIDGTTESDRLYGYDGDDTLNGDQGADILRGGTGDDILDGGTGNDILIGGEGSDTLTGGSGADVFRWEEGDTGGSADAFTDVITDFDNSPVSSGGDLLDFSGVLDGEGKIGTFNAGNLANYLHFVYDGSNTIVYLHTTGGFRDGFNELDAQQSIVIQGVDLVGTATTDQEVIESLLAQGTLLVDDVDVDSDLLGGTTTVDVEIVDGDGDTDTARVDFESSSATPEPDTVANNTAPTIQADSSALGGIAGVSTLGALAFSGQDVTVFDLEGNLQSVEIDYRAPISINLATLNLAVSDKLASELGLNVEIVNDTGLLGLLGTSSTVTITAIDGGDIDNQAINELLSTLNIYDDQGLLAGALSLDLRAEVLNNITLTATDSLGESSSESLGNLVDTNVAEGLLLDNDTSVVEGTDNQDLLDYSAETDDIHIYGYGDDDVINSGAGNDLIRGGGGDDTIDAGAGDDLIFDGSGLDVIDAGEGDDVIYLVGSGFDSINGGVGVDTLMLDGSVNLDLSTNQSITNIEKIAFAEDDTANTLTLTEQAVKDLTETDDELIITGNSTDNVQILGGALEGNTTIDNVVYAEYSLGTTTLYIDDDVNVSV